VALAGWECGLFLQGPQAWEPDDLLPLACVSGVGLTTDDASIEILEQFLGFVICYYSEHELRLHSSLLGCGYSLSTVDEEVLLEELVVSIVCVQPTAIATNWDSWSCCHVKWIFWIV
jgi:hypothetical protein